MQKGKVTALEDVLTPEEIAEMWRLKPHTVRSWIRSGLLPAHKIGRGWRIRRDDWNRFLAEQQQPKKSEGLALAC